MAKDTTLIFIIFFSIAGIYLYKWLNIHKKIKNMYLIKAHVTDVIQKTTYHKNIYEYYYSYTFQNEKYNTSDKLKYNFLWKPKIDDEVLMYIDKKNTNNNVTPWQTYLYKLYFIIMIISLIIPFIVLI